MSTTMLQHFNYPETLSYEGNAELSNASKFGKACAHFKNSTSTVSLTNTTGVFNLSANGSTEAECFIKTIASGGNNTGMDTPMIEELLANGYYMYDGHVFKRYDASKTWTKAKLYCETLGGHLAVCNDEDKYNFFNGLVNGIGTNTPDRMYFWLGGYKDDTNSEWQWVTGEEWDYTNWDTNEPVDNNEGITYGVGINFQTRKMRSFNANSVNGFAFGYFICEWDSVLIAYFSAKDYRFFNGHFFKFFENNTYYGNFEGAEALCEELGGHLATSTSAEKDSFLVSMCNNNPIILGGTYNSEKGEWQWITGEEWDYTNWNTNEPVGSYIAYYVPSGVWTCDYPFTCYICEWDNLDTVCFYLLGYSFYNGHTFKYFSGTKTWNDADSYCKSLGGHLATSTSAEKNTFLTTLTTDTVWLGGTDEAEEGTWQWDTGETWDYTNWIDDNEPYYTGVEVHAYLQTNGRWGYYSTNGTYSYICEWDYDFRESGSGVSNGNILCLSDNSNVVAASDAETQGYKFLNAHTYQLITTGATQNAARIACEALGGHLAVVNSREEFDFLCNWVGNTRTWVEGTKGTTADISNVHISDGVYMDYSSYPFAGAGWGTALFIFNSGYFADEAPDSPTYQYICEWDYDIREPKALTLSIANGGALSLQSAIWGLNETSTLTLEADTWYHILLRLSEGTASVYLNGVQALSGNVSGADITPQALTLGGYKGYMDEFVFRDEAGTGAPVVPTSAYETGTGTVATSNNAPVTRAVWTCEDLPEGLTLSSSGVLSGHPTTAGTYNCDVSVATNWGTATKTITITVIE